MIKDRIDKIISSTKGELIHKKMAFDGGFIKVFEECYKLPDGRLINKESISKNDGKDAAIIITRTIEDKYLIVFQNRINNIVSAEFPSGYIEPFEDVLTGALREVEEETGYVSDSAKIIDSMIPNIGTESSKIYIVYVDNAVKKSSQKLDSDEYINYELFSFDELKYLIDNQIIQSSGNKLAFYHLKDIIHEEEKRSHKYSFFN